MKETFVQCTTDIRREVVTKLGADIEKFVKNDLWEPVFT